MNYRHQNPESQSLPKQPAFLSKYLVEGMAAALLLTGSICPVQAEMGPVDQFRKAGELAFSGNNYGVAEKNFLAALKEAEKLGPHDIRLADACKNLASLYEVRGQFQKAEGYLERDLRAREKALGPENPKVVMAVGKLVRFYLLHGSAAKGDRLANLLTTFADRLIKKEETLAGHFNELEKYFATHSEFAQPAGKLKQVREQVGKIQADDHLEFAACLDSVASAYKDKNRLPQAENMYKKAMTLREKTLQPGHQALAFSYENLANLYNQQGKTELAQPLYRQALDVTSKTLDPKRPEVFARLDSLARNYISMGQEGQAEVLYRQAITLIKENKGSNKDLASASYSLGALYMKQGKAADAAPLFKTALQFNESLSGPESATLIPILESYAAALEKTQKTSEAAKLRTRANNIKGVATACKVESDF